VRSFLSLGGVFALVLLAAMACGGLGEAGKRNEAGAALAAEGSWQQAIAEYDEAIRLKPDLAEAYNNRGAARRALGELEAALADFTEAARLKPDLAAARINVASIRLDLGQTEEAVQDLDRAFSLKLTEPEVASTYLLYGRAHSALGDREAAIDVLSEAIDLDSENADAFYLRGQAYLAIGLLPSGLQGASACRPGPACQRADSDFGNAVRINTEFIGAYVARGDLRVLRGVLAPAIRDYDEAIWREPDNPDYYERRGMAYVGLGRKSEAVADFEHAIRLDPGRAAAYRARGLAYVELGQPDLAISSFDEAVRLDPQDPGSYYGRALAQEELGRTAEAFADFDLAIRLFADDPEAYKGRARAHIELGNLDGAVADLGRAVDLAPRDPEPLRLRAAAYIELGRLDEAISDLTAAIRMDRDDAESANVRGLAYLKLGELENAVRDFSAAISIEGTNNAQYYINKGNASIQLDDPEQAIEDFDEALVRDVRYRFLFKAALSTYERGNHRRALPDLETALELAPVLIVGYQSRSSVLEGLERDEEAESDLGRVTELERDIELIQGLITVIENEPPEPPRPPPAPRRPASAGPSAAEIAAAEEAVKTAIKATEATLHVGKERTVCGTVTAVRQEGERTAVFIDFGPPEPDQDLIVHFQSLATRVGDWPDFVDRSIDIVEWLMNRELCVTGRIERFRGRPAINANFWHQYNLPE
jgi:tetratricopeptide (TPR) repeat protein